MKTYYNFLGIPLALMLVVLVFGQEAWAINTRESCSFNSGTVCTNISDNLAAGATGIDPAQTVNLSFSVYKQADASPPNCNSGRQLFNVVRHYIAGSATNYEYLSAGSGQDMEYSFNSGTDQQANRYVGVFDCWSSSQSASTREALDTLLGLLGREGQTWSSPEFNLRTRVTTINQNCSTITSCANYPVQTDCEGNRCSLSPACRWTGSACVGVTTTSQNITIANPIDTNTFEELIGVIAVWIFNLAIPIAVIVIIYAGVIMLSAGGNPTRFKNGAETLKYAIIGLAVVLIGRGFIALIRSIIDLKDS